MFHAVLLVACVFLKKLRGGILSCKSGADILEQTVSFRPLAEEALLFLVTLSDKYVVILGKLS